MPSNGPELLLRVTDSSVDGMPKNTGAVVTTHVVAKSVQAGSLLGLVLSPLFRLRSKTPRPFLVSLSRPPALGALFGIPIGLAMVVGKSYDMDADGVDDRAYRIVHNAGQVDVDRHAAFGAFVGALVGNFALPGGNPLVRMWRGGSLGLATGVIVYGVTKLEATKDLRSAVMESVEKMKSGL
ncbi:hypothetical protein HDU93_005816 [Gonapodya sp. JEL0774]|nr:hypothetical protein HDU93_006067 [Gonapodya sp. JEL0774]KAJ3335317.1 hypothetical protein HDU93_005816 [Gonapodya sp. JEL0774]